MKAKKRRVRAPKKPPPQRAAPPPSAPDDLMPLAQAAQLARQATKGTMWAMIARLNFADDSLSYYGNALAGAIVVYGRIPTDPDSLVPIWNSGPDSPCSGGASDGATEWHDSTRLNYPYHDLQISRGEVERWIEAAKESWLKTDGPIARRAPATPPAPRLAWYVRAWRYILFGTVR